MSKAKRQKANLKLGPQYPFKLLQWWFKPLHPAPGAVHECRCGDLATYICEGYTNLLNFEYLVTSGVNGKEAITHMWREALPTQRQGKYTLYGTAYHCSSCMIRAIESSVGKNATDMAMKYVTRAAVPISIMAFVRIETAQDDGKMFAAPVPASVTTIEELGHLLRGNSVDFYVSE